MDIKQIQALALATAKNKKEKNVTNYSIEGTVLTAEAMNETLREELNALSQGQFGFEKNKYAIFEIIQKTIDAILPPELNKFFEGVTKVETFGEADKPEITLKRRNKNLRARSFITKVSAAGVYEVFKLAKEGKFQIEMSPIGGAAQLAYEDFLTGRVDWNEMLEVIKLGMEDRIYEEILKMMEKIEKSLPANNKGSITAFDAEGARALNHVLDTITVYGSPVIYCTETFAREITEGPDWASETEKVARRNVGYLANYKGARIVILPQSFEDETNTTKLVDSSKAYIFPSGKNDVIHVALQGDTRVKDVQDNTDWSIEIHTYKKFGVAAFVYNDIATFEITSLKNK